MKTGPLVSVITVCLNSEKTIRRAMESVVNQTYKNIEYIIIDGGSTDKTLTIINDYKENVTAIVSEKDKGISDAFNKGIERATGEFVHLLNADDYWPLNKLELSLQILISNVDYGFVHGDILLCDDNGNQKIHVVGQKDYENKIRYTMGRLNHPTMLIRRECYQKVGLFSLQWRVGMDYDWLLRAHHKGIKGFYDSRVLVYMQMGGNSGKNWIKNYKDTRDIAIHNGCPVTEAYGYYYLRMCKKLFVDIYKSLVPHKYLLSLNKGRSLIAETK